MGIVVREVGGRAKGRGDGHEMVGAQVLMKLLHSVKRTFCSEMTSDS